MSLLEHLEILDLEGNSIEDIAQVQYLGLCIRLTSLTLEGNAICLKPRPQSLEVIVLFKLHDKRYNSCLSYVASTQ